MNASANTCVVCGTTTMNFSRRDGQSRYECPRCGTYRIGEVAAVNMRVYGDVERARISATIRNSKSASPFHLTRELVDSIPRDWRNRTVAEKLDALLLSLADDSKFPGDEVHLQHKLDLGRAWATSEDEFEFFLNALRNRKLLSMGSTLSSGFFITPDGWDRVAELSTSKISSERVFVAMAFDPTLTDAWSGGLQPGITKAGYLPERTDSSEHNDKIDDRIMAMIRAAQFLVVDVTLQNRGAYFEAGFGAGLGRPVIWTVRDDEIDKVHFDTRQFNHVVWTTPADLGEKIESRILGVFGRGPRG